MDNKTIGIIIVIIVIIFIIALLVWWGSSGSRSTVDEAETGLLGQNGGFNQPTGYNQPYGAPLGTGALGVGALGTGALGTGALGTGALGTGALGTGALGNNAFGTGALGTGALGNNAFGTGALGSGVNPYLGNQAIIDSSGFPINPGLVPKGTTTTRREDEEVFRTCETVLSDMNIMNHNFRVLDRLWTENSYLLQGYHVYKSEPYMDNLERNARKLAENIKAMKNFSEDDFYQRMMAFNKSMSSYSMSKDKESIDRWVNNGLRVVSCYHEDTADLDKLNDLMKRYIVSLKNFVDIGITKETINNVVTSAMKMSNDISVAM
jgi:hypothetical protein